MSARNRRASLRSHVEQLQLALSCVTTSVVTTRPSIYRPQEQDAHAYIVTLNNAAPVSLRGRSSVTMAAQEHIVLVPTVDGGRAEWGHRIAGYAYAFRARDRRELLAFHWHPEGLSAVTHPHVHIGAAMLSSDAPVRPSDFHRAHIPTGQVFIEDVARFAIAELGVEPLRADWDAVLSGVAARRQRVP